MSAGEPPASHRPEGLADLRDVAELMGDLARRLQQESASVEDTLQAMTHRAAEVMPGADHVGVTLVRRRTEVETRAATSDVVRRIDAAQYETGEGPCLTALWQHATVRSPDVTSDARWPRFRDRVAPLGVRGMLSFQLFVRGDNLGALNFYSRAAGVFDDEAATLGELFSAHAAVALAGAQEIAGLRTALSSRDVIGSAKGILMERFGLSAVDAFALLARTSQSTNAKLVEVARRIVDDVAAGRGALPDPAGDSVRPQASSLEGTTPPREPGASP